MATSIAEQIAAKVQSRLLDISTTNSYETTASGVKRPTRLGGFRPEDYQLVILQGTITRLPESDHPGNPAGIARVLPFLIRGVLRQSESDSTGSDTL